MENKQDRFLYLAVTIDMLTSVVSGEWDVGRATTSGCCVGWQAVTFCVLLYQVQKVQE
jgi:hypothetical protein